MRPTIFGSKPKPDSFFDLRDAMLPRRGFGLRARAAAT